MMSAEITLSQLKIVPDTSLKMNVLLNTVLFINKQQRDDRIELLGEIINKNMPSAEKKSILNIVAEEICLHNFRPWGGSTFLEWPPNMVSCCKSLFGQI